VAVVAEALNAEPAGAPRFGGDRDFVESGARR
jgi:hypothetical protein